MSVLDANEFTIQKNDSLKEVEKKLIINYSDLSEAYCEADDVYDLYVDYLDKKRHSTSLLTTLIGNLQKNVMEFEMSEDEDVIEERRFQAGVTIELIKTLLNGNPIARYDFEKQQAYLLYRDGRREYLNDD